METLGKRIRERRKQLHLTQNDLAEKLGTSQKQIYKYESGENDPTAGVLMRLAYELETTADWLLGLTEISGRPLRGEGDLSEQEVELLELYRSKAPDDRRKVLDVIKVF